MHRVRSVFFYFLEISSTTDRMFCHSALDIFHFCVTPTVFCASADVFCCS